MDSETLNNIKLEALSNFKKTEPSRYFIYIMGEFSSYLMSYILDENPDIQMLCCECIIKLANDSEIIENNIVIITNQIENKFYIRSPIICSNQILNDFLHSFNANVSKAYKREMNKNMELSSLDENLVFTMEP